MERLNKTVEVNGDLLSAIKEIRDIVKENKNTIVIMSTGVFLQTSYLDLKIFDEEYKGEVNNNALDIRFVGKIFDTKVYVDPTFSIMDDVIRIVEI